MAPDARECIPPSLAERLGPITSNRFINPANNICVTFGN